MSTTALAAVLAKLAGLGSAAKATVGLAVAAGAVGAASGVPIAAHELANVGGEQVVVSTTDRPTYDVTADPTVEPTDDATEPADDATTTPGAQEAERFGAMVSTQARNGGVDGQQVAAAAHERNQLRAENRAADADVPGDRDQTCDPDCTPVGDGPQVGGAGSGRGN